MSERELGEPDPISRAQYQHHEGRIIRLEEFRDSHTTEHTNHVATHAWVYRVGWKALTVTLGLAVSVAWLIVRATIGA